MGLPLTHVVDGVCLSGCLNLSSDVAFKDPPASVQVSSRVFVLVNAAVLRHMYLCMLSHTIDLVM